MINGEHIVNGSTRIYGIIGDPIEQVKSPQVITARFHDAGKNAILIPIHVMQEKFEETMMGIMRIGNLDGLIITIPYKVYASNLAEKLGINAQLVGAINALRREKNGQWVGEMFDGKGLVTALHQNNFSITGAKVKMIGAGGAGSAVAVALAQAGAHRIDIYDIEPLRVQKLAQRINKGLSSSIANFVTEAAEVDGYDLLINCTPIGMLPSDGMPARFGPFPSSLMVVDVIMKPEVTPLAIHAKSFGCQVINGRPMLEGQAAAIVDFFMGAD
jgi:shikimate dehydrogenase